MKKKKGKIQIDEQYVYPPLPPEPPWYYSPKKIIRNFLKKLLSWVENE